MPTKTAFKVYLDSKVADLIIDTHKRFASGGRDVNRSEVIEQLIQDGFKMWAKEEQAVTRFEGTLAHLLDHAEKTDRLLKAILLTLADGDKDEVKNLLNNVDRELTNA